jgi:TPR repeat protein
LRMTDRISWVAVAIVWMFVSVATAQTPAKFPRPIGAGSFPVTFGCASAWFAHHADDNQKLVTMIVYMNGDAGWNRKATDFKWKVSGDPATIEMSVGATNIRIQYSASTGIVEIQGSKYDLAKSNVFVTEGIDTSQPEVKPLGIHDLSFAGDDVPALALLRRDADVWAAVSGRSADEHVKNRNANLREKLVAWDTEGLRLLLTGKPDAQKQGCELFRRAALEGDAASQYRLGYCYESGKGEEQSFSTANDWYEKAAKQGHVDAQYKLGHSYRVGRGTPINLPLAMEWYKKAAANGDSDALNNVAWMYSTGQGVEANSQEAYRWFVEAGKHGDTSSQFEVSRRLREADGVENNLVAAYAWLLILQAQQGDFAAEDWKQIKPVIEAVANKLDKGAIAMAEAEAEGLLATISNNQMQNFARHE